MSTSICQKFSIQSTHLYARVLLYIFVHFMTMITHTLFVYFPGVFNFNQIGKSSNFYNDISHDTKHAHVAPLYSVLYLYLKSYHFVFYDIYLSNGCLPVLLSINVYLLHVTTVQAVAMNIRSSMYFNILLMFILKIYIFFILPLNYLSACY